MNWCITIQLADDQKQQEEKAQAIFDLFAAPEIKVRTRKGTLPPLNRFRYFGFGLEHGTHWHYQCYLQCIKQNTRTSLICFFSDDGHKDTKWGVHLEAAKGTPQQNLTYISKECGMEALNEIGQIELTGQGSRKDIHQIGAAIMEGSTLTEVADMAPHMIIKYHGGIRALIQIKQSKDIPKHRDIRVYVFYGPTRAGKTWTASDGETHPSYHIKKSVDWTKGHLWWPGYKLEKRLIIDDFKCSHMSIGKLMELLDRERQVLDVKNGGTFGNWNEVFITCNFRYPEEWYTGAQQHRREALFARISVVREFTKHWREQTPIIYDGESDGEREEREDFIGPLGRYVAANGFDFDRAAE